MAATVVTVERIAAPLQQVAFLRAPVVRGFGRGAKQLGFPTANMEICWEGKEEAAYNALLPRQKEVLDFITTVEPGIYYGWAQVCDDKVGSEVQKAAISIGWNPTFSDVLIKYEY